MALNRIPTLKRSPVHFQFLDQPQPSRADSSSNSGTQRYSMYIPLCVLNTRPRQADDGSAWDSALMLAAPAAALLACCNWNSSNGGEHGYPGWARRAPVLADAAVPATGRTVSSGQNAAVWTTKAKARAEAALRAARLVWTAVVISAGYKAFDASQVRCKSEAGCGRGVFVFIRSRTRHDQRRTEPQICCPR